MNSTANFLYEKSLHDKRIQTYYRLRSSVARPPKRYGLPKLHKTANTHATYSSLCGSPTYEISKYLTTILQPLTNKSQHKLQSTENAIDAIKTVQIPYNNYKLVSFDVKSLFTSIPLQLALDYTKTDPPKNSLYLQTTSWNY